jgi:hypothetical protein
MEFVPCGTSAFSETRNLLLETRVQALSCARMPVLTDTTLTIRCPYCIAGMDFTTMIAYKDGRFVCRDCAHTVRPGVPDYICSCRTCLRLSRRNYFISRRS